MLLEVNSEVEKVMFQIERHLERQVGKYIELGAEQAPNYVPFLPSLDM